MRVVCIVQARMGSKRLPGKVLTPILGKPLLGYLIERLLRVPALSEIVVATTTEIEDDPIVDYCYLQKVNVYRGSLNDVLARYYEAAVLFRADVIVRITADCPLLDPLLAQQVINHYLQAQGSYDYVSNTQDRSFPRGMDVEVFSFAALQAAYESASDPQEREHVTLYIYRHLEQFRVGSFAYRFTVDTAQDLLFVRHLIESFYPQGESYSLAEMLNVLNRHPEWTKLNAHIRHK